MNKQFVFYHANCADGFAAALVAKVHFSKIGVEGVFYPINYGDWGDDIVGYMIKRGVQPDDFILFVDFAILDPIARNQLRVYMKEPGRVLIYDHHKSALPLQGEPGVFLDMNESGASLTFKLLNPGEEVPELIKYVRDRDLWLWELPDSRAVSAALWSFPWNFTVWLFYMYNVEPLKSQGRGILRFMEQQTRIMAARATFMPISDSVKQYTIPMANATCLFSEVGEELLRLYPDAPFVAYYFVRDENYVQFGLRSRASEDFDVSAVAAHYGGGGHKNAAGFQIAREDWAEGWL